jgi:hypothetical protein
VPAELAAQLEGAAFAIWTTTPWTIPANLAVAVNDQLDYCLVQAQVRCTPGLAWGCAAALPGALPWPGALPAGVDLASLELGAGGLMGGGGAEGRHFCCR